MGIATGQAQVFPFYTACFKDSDVGAFHANMVQFGDSCNWSIHGSGANAAPDNWADEAVGNSGRPAFRHGGRAHFVLASGKVVKLTKAEVTDTTDGSFARYWPTTGGSTNATMLKRNTAPY